MLLAITEWAGPGELNVGAVRKKKDEQVAAVPTDALVKRSSFSWAGGLIDPRCEPAQFEDDFAGFIMGFPSGGMNWELLLTQIESHRLVFSCKSASVDRRFVR